MLKWHINSSLLFNAESCYIYVYVLAVNSHTSKTISCYFFFHSQASKTLWTRRWLCSPLRLLKNLSNRHTWVLVALGTVSLCFLRWLTIPLLEKQSSTWTTRWKFSTLDVDWLKFILSNSSFQLLVFIPVELKFFLRTVPLLPAFHGNFCIFQSVLEAVYKLHFRFARTAFASWDFPRWNNFSGFGKHSREQIEHSGIQ